MSHPPSWQRNPRKLGLELRRSSAEELALIKSAKEGAELAEKAAREGGHVVTFYDHGPDLYMTGITPCTTFGYLSCKVELTCFGCGRRSPLTWDKLAHTRWSHTPWPKVMSALGCSACGERPESLYFRLSPRAAAHRGAVRCPCGRPRRSPDRSTAKSAPPAELASPARNRRSR